MSPFAQERLDRVLTQYRESPRLLGLIEAALEEINGARAAIEAIPDALRLDDAQGWWLTALGKRMGWPRQHYVSIPQPIFALTAPDYEPARPVTGLCDDAGVWIDCAQSDASIYEVTDDETYRRMLRVRAIQQRQTYDEATLLEALREAFGPDAEVISSRDGRIVAHPGPDYDANTPLAQLWPRLMPIRPGAQLVYHLGDARGLWGFGRGWAGMCGLEIVPLATERGDALTTEDGDLIEADGLSTPGRFTCPAAPTGDA